MNRLCTGVGGGFQEFQEGSPSALELFQVVLLAVRRTCFPAAEQNADPLEGQASQWGIVSFADGALLQIEGLGPGGLFVGARGELVKGLQEELVAGPATLNDAAFAAAFGNRRDTR